MENLQRNIAEWEKKALDLSQRLAEFNRIKGKADRLKTLYERLMNNLKEVNVSQVVDTGGVHHVARDGAVEPLPWRIPPGIWCAAGGPGDLGTHGASGAARARLRGHKVKLVAHFANPKRPRSDVRRRHLSAVRNLGGAAGRAGRGPARASQRRQRRRSSRSTPRPRIDVA